MEAYVLTETEMENTTVLGVWLDESVYGYEEQAVLEAAADEDGPAKDYTVSGFKAETQFPLINALSTQDVERALRAAGDLWLSNAGDPFDVLSEPQKAILDRLAAMRAEVGDDEKGR